MLKLVYTNTHHLQAVHLHGESLSQDKAYENVKSGYGEFTKRE